MIGIRTDKGRLTLIEQLRRLCIGYVKRVVSVNVQSPGIHSLGFLAQLKIHTDIVLGQQAGTVGRAGKGLFNRHVRHEIQVNVFRYIQNDLLHEVSRIEGHIQVPGKPESFRVERYEAQIHTRLSGHVQCVEQVIFVVIRGDVGKRADKTLQEQRNVILENIHLPKNLSQELLDTVTREHLIHSR